ncbi:signal transduction histidine kinase [Kitasatospora sp. MAP12-15]|uniref:sensor histidine kinase n=1 Tax=unclassified Kitasatospora TaxID=2633591 RepID=UPI002474C257|nr:ATP-binding protein [Kitasatospora sp. MAP12-44]MDH6115284.1 signal transduction histidine kinase [Kitasatospora sp. MAP12-44]
MADHEAVAGLRRARSFMVLATMLYRASHLAGGFLVLTQHHRDGAAPWALLGTAALCSVLVFRGALRDGWFAARAVWLDVVVSGCALPLLALACGAGRDPASIAWVVLLGSSASATAAVAFEGGWIVGAVVLVAAAHLSAYQTIGAGTAVLGSDLNSLASSAILAWVFWWYLRREGRLLEQAGARALAAEALKARYAERLEHHRALHDTVLATLTAIAGGGVDANGPLVRERCAREAAYLRRLIQRTADEEHHPQVGAALEEAVRSAESLNLRVTAQYHDLPPVPAEVAAALGDAVTEALNNVRRHAGTGHAYLTAAGGPGRLVVSVVDRGTGFDPARVVPGLGLRCSVQDRLREVGGLATVESSPGEGVCVELRWPR